MEVILIATLDVDKDKVEELKKLEHHIEYLLDLDSHPEIKSVYGVQVTPYNEVDDKFPTNIIRASNGECKGDLLERIDLVDPTVEEMIVLLSQLPKNTKFYTSGCNQFSLYINRQRDYCTVDDSNSVYEEE